MPKKTKREKIIADLRRKLAQQNANNSTPFPSSSEPSIKPQVKPQKTDILNLEFKKKENNPTILQTSALTIDPTYIKKDLYKTVLVTLFILALEFALYFILEKRILNIF